LDGQQIYKKKQKRKVDSIFHFLPYEMMMLLVDKRKKNFNNFADGLFLLISHSLEEKKKKVSKKRSFFYRISLLQNVSVRSKEKKNALNLCGEKFHFYLFLFSRRKVFSHLLSVVSMCMNKSKRKCFFFCQRRMSTMNKMKTKKKEENIRKNSKQRKILGKE
jgi:hypothetical protein